MKETGIIMSGDHPKLIPDGIKTMTRRVIKPQPTKGAWNATVEHPSYGWFWKGLYQDWEGEADFFKRLAKHCPYGQVGDRLWVRETCKIMDFGDHKGVVAYKTTINPDELTENLKWIPSIHMPRWASRILLEITEIRAERLQEITLQDVIAEGISQDAVFAGDAFLHFGNLWNRLNAKRGYGWDKNPWVWVISFKKVD